MQSRQTKICLPVLMIVLCSWWPGVTAAQTDDLPPWRQDLPAARQAAEIVVGGKVVPVELALSSAEQQLGLGYRNGLDDGAGMLFVFDTSEARTFWMKGMRFCLDIIWIDGGAVTGAAESVCPDPDGTADIDRARFSSPGPAGYVLEMDAGWLQQNGFGAGTEVAIPDELQGP